jgi:shikimate dehydrogenase
MTDRRRRCAVLGSPIEHSLSPVLHRAAYAVLGLDDWIYERHQVGEAELADFVARCDGTWRGLSLTMPLKARALELGQVDPLAALAGAANTLIFTDDGPQLFNTDVGGLVAAVRQTGIQPPGRVTIVGAGSTARSALVSAAKLGAGQVTLLARNPQRAVLLQPLARLLDVSLDLRGWDDELPTADLVISTVTAGAVDARAREVAASAPVIFDAIYDPWPTALAEEAVRAGRTVVNGLDLLVEQAVLQIELMTNRRIASAVLMSAGRAALSAAAHQ